MGNTLFAIGEALIDFIPAQAGCAFEDVTAFSPKAAERRQTCAELYSAGRPREIHNPARR